LPPLHSTQQSGAVISLKCQVEMTPVSTSTSRLSAARGAARPGEAVTGGRPL